MRCSSGIALIAVIALIGLAVMYFGHGGKTLSAVTPSCTDFHAGRGRPARLMLIARPSSFRRVENLSDNVELRCNAGSCEMRVLRCGVIQP